MGGDVIVYLFIAAILVLGSIVAVREWRERDQSPPPRSRSSAIGDAVEGVVGCIGGMIGCVFFFVLGLVGLFFVIWLLKRMWEAA
jgi:hypothetical protein